MAPCRNRASNLLHARKTIPVNVMFYSRLLSSSALAPSLSHNNLNILPQTETYLHGSLSFDILLIFSACAGACCQTASVFVCSIEKLWSALPLRLKGWGGQICILAHGQTEFGRVKRAGWVAELKMKHLQLNCLMSNFLNMLMLLKSGWLENTKLDLWSGSFKREFKE